MNTPQIRKALNVMETVNFTPLERELYEAHLDYWRMEDAVFKARLIKAREKGKAERKAEGETERQYKVAKKSLAAGLTVQMVAEITELSIEEVERIKATITPE